MGKIVALGGGEIGRPHEKGGFYPVETTLIDKRTIELTKKKYPKVLFLPTASSDSEHYYEDIKKHFGERLGCKVDVLNIIKDKPTREIIENKILTTDIIYVGGGNTLKMMNKWRTIGIDKLLLKAYKRGVVMTGLSVGSICWFECGLSDSRRFRNPNADLIKVSGLKLINAVHSPHYDVEEGRKVDLKKIMKKTSGLVAIAIDNCCAIEVVDGKYKIIDSKSTANAYKVYWKRGKYFEEQLEKTENYKNLNELISK